MQTDVTEPSSAPATKDPTPTHTDKSRLKQKLDSLKSPFKNITRSSSLKAKDDEEVPKSVTKIRKKGKKNKPDIVTSAGSGATTPGDVTPREEVKKKKDVAGALKRKLGSLTRSFSMESENLPLSLPPPPKEEDSHSGSNVEDTHSSSPHMSTASSQEVDPPVSDVIAAEHPVSTLPFVKSTWTRKRPEPELPVERPSPESALKRRIAFVAQASACLSVDADAPTGGGGSVGVAGRPLTPHSPDTTDGHRTDTDEESDMPAYGDILAAHPMNMGAETSHASTSVNERREHLYKILVIGELGTGKTSIIKRYVHQFFSDHYRATIGVDFALKVLNWDANTVIRLQLWDIAGQERYGSMTRVYYKEAVGAFIVFDVTRVATFEAVVKWKNDLDSKVQLPDGSPVPCILLANKCEQQKEGIVNNTSKMDEFCKEKGFVGWYETSAKENINIDEAARSLVNKILLNDKILQGSDGLDNEKFTLEHRIANGTEPHDRGGKSCAC